MTLKRQEDDAGTKIWRAQNELERVQKEARRDRNKKWKPVFQELQQKIRERNARLKWQQKMAGKHVV
jgi:peptidoglycan hydrolase CwlO-like protein